MEFSVELAQLQNVVGAGQGASGFAELDAVERRADFGVVGDGQLRLFVDACACACFDWLDFDDEMLAGDGFVLDRMVLCAILAVIGIWMRPPDEESSSRL